MDTKGEKSNASYKPQRLQKHPDEWEQDLNPTHMEGQNLGPLSSDQERGVPTAYDVKDVHRSLNDFPDDELKQIPIVPEGQLLQQGATYIDLRDPDREEFTATGGVEAGTDNYYVPKDAVPYFLWNRLIGVENPDRRNVDREQL